MAAWWVKWLLGILFCFLALGSMGCSHERSSDSAAADGSQALRREVSAAEIMNSPDFALEMGDGGGLFGANVLLIAGDGHCSYEFTEWKPGAHQGKRAEFDVGPQTIRELRQLLVDVKFFSLEKSYQALVSDGVQRWVTVTLAERSKRVDCSNEFPEPFSRVYEFVRTQVLDAHAADLTRAKVLESR